MRRNSVFLLAALALPPKLPSIEIQGFHLNETKADKNTLEMRADHAGIYKPEDIVGLDVLRAFLWGKDERPFEITGHLGILDSKTQDFDLPQDAQLTSPDGYVFDTRDAHYDAEERTLTTNEPVEGQRVHGKKGTSMKMTGNGLIVKMNENTYEIRRNAAAEQKLPGKKGFNIRSRSALILPEKNESHFLKDVTVKSENTEMRGDRLKILFSDGRAQEMLLERDDDSANKVVAKLEKMSVNSDGLRMFLGEDGGMDSSQALGDVDAVTSDGTKLHADRLTSGTVKGKNRILLEGNVRIVTDKRVATCEMSEFFPDTGDIILNRVAAVVSADDKIQGELIRFSTKNSEIYVEKASGSVDRKKMGL